jgi:hypothetical protein
MRMSDKLNEIFDEEMFANAKKAIIKVAISMILWIGGVMLTIYAGFGWWGVGIAYFGGIMFAITDFKPIEDYIAWRKKQKEIARKLQEQEDNKFIEAEKKRINSA